MGADVGHDDVRRLERAAQVDDRALWGDRPAVVRGVRGELLEQLHPQVGMDEDLARLVPLRGTAAADAHRLDRLEQPAQGPIDIADELDLGPVRGVDLGGLRIDMDDPLAAVRVPRRRGVFDEVVADADDEVGPVEARQDVIARLEPDRHERQVRPVVDRALAHERDGDRDVQAAGERAQLRRSAPSQYPVAGQDDRPLGGGDQARRVVDGLVGRLGEVGVSRCQRHRRRPAVGRTDVRRGEVLGQLDVRRPGLLEHRDPEGLAHDLGDRPDALDARVPLRDRLEHPHDVDDLVRFLVELARGGLAGDGDHRRAVEVGVGDARDEVRRTGTERAHRDGGTTGEPAMDVGHERGALLVAGRDVTDRLVARQRVEDVHRLLAGDAEDVLAALRREAVDEQVGGAPRSIGGHVRSVGQ